MSTRSTVWYGKDDPESDGLHLYREMGEEDSPLMLEIQYGPFCAVIRLPGELLKALRAAGEEAHG